MALGGVEGDIPEDEESDSGDEEIEESKNGKNRLVTFIRTAIRE